MKSKENRLIISMVGLLVGLAALACGTAARSSPTSDLAAEATATSTTATAQPVATTALGASNNADATEPPNQPAKFPETILDNTKGVHVDLRQFRQLLPRDAINPIYEPQFLPGRSVVLDPQALVIGVAINGESKAYPVGPLNRREMVNDVVGGVPILVTW